MCFGETAFSTLCLNAAQGLNQKEFDDVVIQAARLRGIEWLNSHMDGWFYGYIQRGELLPLYNIALAILCYHQLGPANFGESYAAGVREGENRLIQSRCRDGGWRSRNWGAANNDIESNNSEPGATSFALRACSTFLAKDRAGIIEQAADCLVSLMNVDGSWSDTDGRPSVTKTCDGVLGLLAATEFGVTKNEYAAAIDHAIVWLQNQEKPVVLDGLIIGWGWDYVPEGIESKVFTDYILKRAVDPQDKQFLNTAYFYDTSSGTYKLRPGMAKAETARLMALFINCGYGYDYIGTCLTLEAMVRLKDPGVTNSDLQLPVVNRESGTK